MQVLDSDDIHVVCFVLKYSQKRGDVQKYADGSYSGVMVAPPENVTDFINLGSGVAKVLVWYSI